MRYCFDKNLSSYSQMLLTWNEVEYPSKVEKPNEQGKNLGKKTNGCDDFLGRVRNIRTLVIGLNARYDLRKDNGHYSSWANRHIFCCGEYEINKHANEG